jgi:hypothetical protein
MWRLICANPPSLAGLQALGTRGRGSASHLWHGPQAPNSESCAGLEPAHVHNGLGTWSAISRLQRCWATTSPETPTFTAGANDERTMSGGQPRSARATPDPVRRALTQA